jgi:hypothetical protein
VRNGRSCSPISNADTAKSWGDSGPLLKIPRSVRQDVPTHQDGGQIQETLMNVCVTFVSDEQPTEAV